MHKIDDIKEPINKRSWPPELNKYIIVHTQSPDKQIYIGLSKKILDNNEGALIHLVKKSEYLNKKVIDYIDSKDDPNNFMLVYEADTWDYINQTQIIEILSGNNSSYIVDAGMGPEKKHELMYDNIHSSNVTINNKYYPLSVDDPKINVPLNEIINSQDMDDFEFVRKDLENLPLADTTINDNPINIDIKFQKELLNILEDYAITDPNKPSDIPPSTNPNKPIDIPITDSRMISQFINNEDTLKLESEKIIRYFKENAFHLSGANQENNEDKFYKMLYFIYYNGYVHIFRKDVPLKEIITHQLLKDTSDNPKLKILGLAEYDIPIRHNVLKYILFQNEIQKNMNVDQQLLIEAELVLSQEYIIALTPEPRYQIWCIIRLIKLWYADTELQNNIRKIKLLVNQYRARVDKKYNIHNGIRFSIGVYPRYGKASATIVLKKIMYYFSLYFQAVGWNGNPPSYFKVVNNLVSYTNCDQTLKLYYRRIAKANGESNNVFSKNYTTMNSPGNNTDILEQYVKISR